MTDVKIQATLVPNGEFPIVRAIDVFGDVIIADDLAGLQNWTHTQRMCAGQLGIAKDTNTIYLYTVINTPPSVPHVLIPYAPSELTADQLAAIQGANSPTSSNVFATINDLSGSLPIAHKESSNSSSSTYYSGLAILTNGQTSFTLSASPVGESSFNGWWNGQEILDGVHYTRIGVNITWIYSVPLETTHTLVFQYNVASSSLAYNETGNILVTTWTGPTASPPSTNIRLSKLGKTVSLYMETWSATGNGSTGYINSGSGVIPLAYRPASTTYGSVATETTLSNDSLTYALGRVLIQSDGSIIVKKDEASSDFNPGSGKNFKFQQGPTIGWILS